MRCFAWKSLLLPAASCVCVAAASGQTPAPAKTPTLIQQGSADRRVPVANSFELRQALEDHGVPVNKPKQQRAVMEENENWFDHYIWGDPLAESLTPVVKPAKP